MGVWAARMARETLEGTTTPTVLEGHHDPRHPVLKLFKGSRPGEPLNNLSTQLKCNHDAAMCDSRLFLRDCETAVDVVTSPHAEVPGRRTADDGNDDSDDDQRQTADDGNDEGRRGR